MRIFLSVVVATVLAWAVVIATGYKDSDAAFGVAQFSLSQASHSPPGQIAEMQVVQSEEGIPAHNSVYYTSNLDQTAIAIGPGNLAVAENVEHNLIGIASVSDIPHYTIDKDKGPWSRIYTAKTAIRPGENREAIPERAARDWISGPNSSYKKSSGPDTSAMAARNRASPSG